MDSDLPNHMPEETHAAMLRRGASTPLPLQAGEVAQMPVSSRLARARAWRALGTITLVLAFGGLLLGLFVTLLVSQ